MSGCWMLETDESAEVPDLMHRVVALLDRQPDEGETDDER